VQDTDDADGGGGAASITRSARMRAYIPDSFPDYMTLSDRRRAGYVDEGVPQCFVTTCQQTATPADVDTDTDTTTTEAAAAEATTVASITASNTLTAAEALSRHQVVYTDTSLCKEARPWRKHTSASDATNNGTDIDAVLRTVFEDDMDSVVSSTIQNDGDDDGVNRPALEESAYETLDIFTKAK